MPLINNINNRYSPFKSLYPISDLIWAFTSRQMGNMSLFYSDTKDALQNREYFLDGLGVNYQDLVCAKQSHGSSIRAAKEKDAGKGALAYEDSLADTDALITQERNLPLAIFTADCLSIFLYDHTQRAIGLIHAGWKGSKQHIALKTIQAMQDKFNTRPSDLCVGFGPAIRECCYEVGREFKEYFAQDLIERDNRYYLDLVRINKEQILALGIKPENIFDTEICTSCQNEEFFSYRKQGENCGRMMSVTMLK